MDRQLYSVRRHLLLVIIAAALILVSPVTAQSDSIQRAALLHDSRNDFYRIPGGAVTVQTPVTLRLQAAAGDLDSASVDVLRSADGKETLVPMHVVATTPEGVAIWEATIDPGSHPGVDTYRFQVTKGVNTLYYEDDTRPNGFDTIEANKGGVGAVYDQSPGTPYQITVYKPDFYTPEWMRNAIIYQIFPDRFRDGDPSNDPEDGSDVFYGDLPLIAHETWNEPPVDGRTTTAPDGSGYYNSDFYGGDLAGIIEKLDYLKSLGITAIYLNPIFEARSNHRYDTADYLKIDPMLGDLDTFRQLVAAARTRGIHLILDGVFNHVSSDSAYFDRYHRFPTDGACESLSSPYRDWFTFVAPKAGQPSPCAQTPENATYYASWAGFDSIPRLNSPLFEVRRTVFLDKNSVVSTWMKEGIGGWRLDVANEIDDGSAANNYWETFRAVVRRLDPEAVIVGEEWNDASPWLTGDQWDSTMNYRFRRAILGFARQTDFSDDDGRIPTLSPSAFDASVRAVEEDYPPMAYHALMNLLDSHDTTRLRFAVDDSLQAQKLAALTEFTLPGAPTVYYGDEIALDAPDVRDAGGVLQDDPYNRAPYPWPDASGNHYPPPNADMLAFYQTLGALRNQNAALRQGKMVTLLTDDANGVYAFLRLDAPSGNATLVVLNRSGSAQTATISLNGLIPDNLTWTSVFGGDHLSFDVGSASVTVPATSGEIWVGSGQLDSFVAPSPPNGLAALGTAGHVQLRWQPVDGASGYIVYRSYVATGGFLPLSPQPTTETSLVDTGVTNGFKYFYTVAAVGATGLYGAPGTAVSAVPSLTPDKTAYVDMPPTQTVELVQGASVTIHAAIQIDNLTGSDGQALGVLAQAAIVPDGTPLNQADWQPMTYARDDGEADVYQATLFLQTPGKAVLVARFSTDAAESWIMVRNADSSQPQLVVSASSDTTPPPAPAALSAVRASISGVALEWTAVDDKGLSGYRLYRADGNNEMKQIADVSSSVTRYIDKAVVDGANYVYAVAALDNALNESALTKTDQITVRRAVVPVIFTIEVPASTTGDVYLAGSFGSKDYPTWDPAGIKLTSVDETHWTVTLNLPEGTAVEYKFTRGAWEQVEKGANCEEIQNRRLTVVLGDDNSLSASGVVQKWRDIDCGG